MAVSHFVILLCKLLDIWQFGKDGLLLSFLLYVEVTVPLCIHIEYPWLRCLRHENLRTMLTNVQKGILRFTVLVSDLWNKEFALDHCTIITAVGYHYVLCFKL